MFIDHIISLEHVIDKILNLMNFLEIMVTAVNKCTASVFFLILDITSFRFISSMTGIIRFL